MSQATAVEDPFIDDEFEQPASGYGKVEDLEGALCLITPRKIESVPNRFKPGENQNRATCDVVVLDGPNAGAEHTGMYISQVAMVSRLAGPLSRGGKLLTRVERQPNRQAIKDGLDTIEKVDEALKKWAAKGGKGAKPQFVWVMSAYTDADAEVARAYLARKPKPKDPFAED